MRASEYINLNAGVLKPPRGKFSAGFYINRPAGEATFEKIQHRHIDRRSGRNRCADRGFFLYEFLSGKNIYRNQ